MGERKGQREEKSERRKGGGKDRDKRIQSTWEESGVSGGERGRRKKVEYNLIPVFSVTNGRIPRDGLLPYPV